jgi:hypothetical protein
LRKWRSEKNRRAQEAGCVRAVDVGSTKDEAIQHCRGKMANPAAYLTEVSDVEVIDVEGNGNI